MEGVISRSGLLFHRAGGVGRQTSVVVMSSEVPDPREQVLHHRCGHLSRRSIQRIPAKISAKMWFWPFGHAVLPTKEPQVRLHKCGWSMPPVLTTTSDGMMRFK